MRSSIRKREYSVFVKVFFIFVIFILPLYLFSVQIITTGKNDVRREILQAESSKLGLYVNTLENDFYNIMTLKNQLLLDKDLTSIARLNGFSGVFDEARAMLNIKDKLTHLKGTSRYVEDAFVFVPSMSKKIDADYIDDIKPEEYEKFKNYAFEQKYPFTYDKNDIYIVVSSYVVNTRVQNMSNPSYILCIKISSDKLSNVLANFFDFKEGGALLLASKNGLNKVNIQDGELLSKLSSYINDNNSEELKVKTGELKIRNKNYIISYEYSQLLHSTLIVYQTEEKLLPALKRYSVWIWVISIVTVMVVAAFSFWIKRMIVKPLDKLIGAFNNLDDGDVNVSVSYSSNDEFGYLYKRFNKMCSKMRVLIQEAFEQKIQAKNAELKQLQYQINPHFLYNCFFLINRMAKMHDEEGVAALTHHMGNYYQFVTRSSSDEVPLVKEVNHIRDYTEIQAFRFSRRIGIEFEDFPEELSELRVPRLIFQPIIENAYNHGLKDKVKDGLIRIYFERQDNLLRLCVEDNGENLTAENLEEIKQKLSSTDENTESTGIVNVHRRLRIKYGPQGGITVSRASIGGLKVQLNLTVPEGGYNVQNADC